MKIESLRELYVEELKDLYYAENQLLKALPKLAGKAATSPALRKEASNNIWKRRKAKSNGWRRSSRTSTKARRERSARRWKDSLKRVRK